MREKIILYLEERVKHWYIIVSILILAQISNDKLLRNIIPEPATLCISMIIIVCIIVYLNIVFRHLINNFYTYTKDNKQDIFEQINKLEERIQSLHQENVQLQNKIVNNISELSAQSSTEAKEVIENIRTTSNDVVTKLDENHINVIEEVENNTTALLANGETSSKIITEKLDVKASEVQANLDKLQEELVQVATTAQNKIVNNISELSVQSSTEAKEFIENIMTISNDVVTKLDENHINVIKEVKNNTTNLLVNGEASSKIITEKLDVKASEVQANLDKLQEELVQVATIAQNKIVNNISELGTQSSGEAKEIIENIMTISNDVVTKLDENHINIIEEIKNNTTNLLVNEEASSKLITEKLDIKASEVQANLDKLQEELVQVATAAQNEVINNVSELGTQSSVEAKEIIENIMTISNDVVTKLDENHINVIEEVKNNTTDLLVNGEDSRKLITEKLEVKVSEVQANLDKIQEELVQANVVGNHIINDISKLSAQNSLEAKGVMENITFISNNLENKIDKTYKNINISTNNIDMKIKEQLKEAKNIQNEIVNIFSSLDEKNINNTERVIVAVDLMSKNLGIIINDKFKEILKQTNNNSKKLLENILQINNHINTEYSVVLDEINSYSDGLEINQVDLELKLDNIEEQIKQLNMLNKLIMNVVELRSESKVLENPDRLEEIYDKETGITIVKHYKNNRLNLSEMKSGNKKNYEVEYGKDGRIVTSRNYDSKENLITEMKYHENGQVKQRIEKLQIDGKFKTIRTNFNNNGEKIN